MRLAIAAARRQLSAGNRLFALGKGLQPTERLSIADAYERVREGIEQEHAASVRGDLVHFYPRSVCRRSQPQSHVGLGERPGLDEQLQQIGRSALHDLGVVGERDGPIPTLWSNAVPTAGQSGSARRISLDPTTQRANDRGSESTANTLSAGTSISISLCAIYLMDAPRSKT